MVRRAVGDGEEVARVREIRRRHRGRGDGVGYQAELLEEALVERALDLEGAGRVLIEHDDPAVLGRAGRHERERPRELAQVERVLHRVELEALALERAVHEPTHEGVAQDGRVDRPDRPPELLRERHAVFYGRVTGPGRRAPASRRTPSPPPG